MTLGLGSSILRAFQGDLPRKLQREACVVIECGVGPPVVSVGRPRQRAEDSARSPWPKSASEAGLGGAGGL